MHLNLVRHQNDLDILTFFKMHGTEKFISNMFHDWVKILEDMIGMQDKSIYSLRMELDTWFMECYHARNEVRMVPEGSNNMVEHLYNRYLLKKMSSNPIFYIPLAGVLAKIEELQQCEWVEKAIECVESELALIEKYTTIKLNLDEVRENEELNEGIANVHNFQKNLEIHTTKLQSEKKNLQDNIKTKQSLQERLNEGQQPQQNGRNGYVKHVEELETEIKNLDAAITAINTKIANSESQIIQSNKDLLDNFNNLYLLLSSIIVKLNSKVTVWKEQFKLYFVKLAQMPMLEVVETRCAHIGKLVYDILHKDVPNITNIHDVLVPLTNVVDHSSCCGEIKHKFTKLLKDFFQSTFLVTEQESCIIKKGNKSMPKIVLRILAAETIMPSHVEITTMYLSEDDIDLCCGNIDLELMKKKDKQFGETVKFNMIEQKISGKFEAIFESLVCGKKIDRTSGKAVHKEKYRIRFETTIYGQTYWTISLPLVVTTGSNQGCLSEWSVLWQCYGSDVYEVPIKTREQLKWCEVADMLNRKLLYVCPSRPLSKENICHLKRRLFGFSITNDDELVSMKKLEVKMSKPNSTEHEYLDFSFLEWFVGIFNLIKSHLQTYWNEGLIDGFISKEEAKKKLQDCSRSGTFILRFSDTKMLKSQGFKTMFGHLTACLMVITTDAQGQKFKNFHDITVAGNTKLAQHSLAHILNETRNMDKPVYKYLYPGKKSREELFDNYCDKAETVVNGYTESKEAFVVSLSQEFCKMQIKTGKRECMSMASKSISGSQETETAVKKKCTDENPAIKTLLQSAPEIQLTGLTMQQQCSVVSSPPASAVCLQSDTNSIVQLPEEHVSGGSAHKAWMPVTSRKDSSEKTLPPSQGFALYQNIARLEKSCKNNKNQWIDKEALHTSENMDAAATSLSCKENQSNTGVSWNNKINCTYSTTDALPCLSPFSDNAMTVAEAASCPSESPFIHNLIFDQTCSQATPGDIGNLQLIVNETLQILVKSTSLDYIKLLLSQYEEGQGQIQHNNSMLTNSPVETDGQILTNNSMLTNSPVETDGHILTNDCISVNSLLETTTSPSDGLVSSEDFMLWAESDLFDVSIPEIVEGEAMESGSIESNMEDILNAL